MTDRRKKYENELPKKGLMRFVSIVPKKYENMLREKCKKLREEHLAGLNQDAE